MIFERLGERRNAVDDVRARQRRYRDLIDRRAQVGELRHRRFEGFCYIVGESVHQLADDADARSLHAAFSVAV